MENIQELYGVCKQIQNTNSTKEKMLILKNNQNNVLFIQTVYFLLNDYIITGISSKKIHKVVDTRRLHVNSLLDVFIYLKKNNTGRDEDIAYVQSFLYQFNSEIKEFLEKIITKKLRLGIDAKTANKVYGKDFIPTWEVQQSYSIDKYPVKEGTYFYLSEKLNGIRCTYLNGKLMSRQGQEFEGLEHILHDIDMFSLNDYFIDGELIRKNYDNLPDNENFRLTTSIVSADDSDKTELKFVIFDIFPASQLKNGESLWLYGSRKKCLIDLSTKIAYHGNQNLEIVPFIYEGNDRSMIDYHLKQMDDLGKEGLMLNKDVVYKCKRHNGCLKIKSFKTADLEIIGYEEGFGRLAGTLGAIIVKFKDNTVNVGSGFTDEQRKSFWENKDELIGRIAEIKYKEISKDSKTNKESLQFPVFVTMRSDKIVESLN